MISALRYISYTLLLIIVSPAAHAQHISNAIALAALSPIFVVLLAGILGWLERRLLSGIVNVCLVLVWVIAFAVLSNLVTNDWLIWMPVALYALHSFWILAKLATILVKKRITTKQPSA
jgi:hypothetical protein